MDKSRGAPIREGELVYLGGSTIFLVRHGRVVGMYLLYTEAPIGKDAVNDMRIGRVGT